MVGVSRIRCTPSAVIRNLAASVAVRRTPRLRTPGSVDCFVKVRVRVRDRHNQHLQTHGSDDCFVRFRVRVRVEVRHNQHH